MMNHKSYLSRKRVRLSTYLPLSSVSFVAFAFAQSNPIVVDQVAHQGKGGAPHIVQSSNGTDVLNIVKPTAGGVSHNKFLEYNVSEQNLILNNHTYKTGILQGKSTLGDTVAFNPNFGTGNAARIILNEVTSNSTTALEGYTEIFGQRAALVIANPNGITAAGAGFINLSRLTMVTGKPNMVEGKLQDFAISPIGTIRIEGKGEQAFGLHIPESPAELVSNAVKIAGNIYVDNDQELNIKTGNHQYDYNTKQVTSKSDTAAQSILALDSSALGGMYAGTIKIEATQSGMGVKIDGNLVSDMDNLEITADGDIAFRNVAAKNDIKVASASGSVEHKKGGIAHTEQDLTIIASKDIALNGTSYASNDILTEAKENLNIQGIVFASNNINLTAQQNIALEGEFVLSDTLNVKAGQNLNLAMQVAAAKSADIMAGNDFNLKKEFINADTINIEVARHLTNNGKLVADTDLTVNVGKTLTNNNIILAKNTAMFEVGGDSLLNQGSVSATNLTIHAKTLTNNAQITTDETLTLNTTDDITNHSKITAGTNAALSANNIHNLGQIASNDTINISTQNDYINHRDSGLFAGVDIIIESGKDIINYLAEIFAGNNIELKGKNAKISTVNPNTVYDNPNVENHHTASSPAKNNQEIQNGEFDEEDEESLEITLTDSGKVLTIPAEAFAEEPNLGDSYILDDYTIYIGERIVTAEPDSEPTITFQNIDKLTILDADGNEVAYTLWDEIESGGEIIDNSDKTEERTSEAVKERVINTPFVASQDQFNALVNLGGRIESLNDITIQSDKLYNMGLNHNIGSDAYSTYYHKIRDSAPYNAGWLELGRYKISEVHLDAEAATILAGHDLNIHSREILNQSATFSAKNNATINTAQLKNQTYSEIVKLAIKTQSRTKKRKLLRKKKRTYNATEYYNERIYSNEVSLITAGNNLVINAAGGNVVNDQVEAAIGSFRFGRDKMPDLKSGQVAVNLTLPRGDNGMFAVSNGDPKYMIRTNVDFFNDIPFAGSDYFFDRITPLSNEYNTRKMLGDSAYETRIIMDAIRQATYGHYLGNGEISSDLDQMKALYNNATKEYERLGLKIGIALTAEQIAQLNSDVIWYVEKEVNGEKVLVPELYLSQATLDNIKIGGYGAKMVGKNIAINADNISNSSDMFAQNELMLKAQDILNESNFGKTARIIGGRTNIEADTLINKSGNIGGAFVTIKANNLLNETKKYTEETRRGANYDLIEKSGQEAVIFGDKDLQIQTSGIYASKGAKLESKEGNVLLKAENIVLDTLELHNRKERRRTNSGFASKKTTTSVQDKLENFGSTIVAGGNALVEAVGDIFSKGSKVEAGQDAQLTANGNITAVAAINREYSYSKTQKSSWGGLKKSLDEISHEENKLRGSNIKTTEGLTIVSGKDTTFVASDIEAGADVNILAGYRAGAEGKLEKSGKQGSVNLLNGEETIKHSEIHEKTGVSLGGRIGFQSGKLNVDINIHEKTKDTWDNVQKTAVSSNITAGGDINIGATKDVNIKGSNVISDDNINITAKENINIVSSQSTEYDEKTHSKSKISATLTGGHVFVDTVHAISKTVKTAEDVKQSFEELDNIRRLQSEGKANDRAFAGGTVNLVASALSSVNTYGVGAILVSEAIRASDEIIQVMQGGIATVQALGFYGGIGFKYDTTETTTSSTQVVNTESAIIADKDIRLNAGSDLNQLGSFVISTSGNIDYIAGNDFNLTSSTDSYYSRSQTSKNSISAGITSKKEIYGDFATSNSANKANGEQHNNSTTIATEGKIAIDAGNDMNARGYNALAKDIEIKVGGDMLLASQQNSGSSYAKGQSLGFGSGTRMNGNLSVNSQHHNRQWVDNQASIIGTESVKIDIDGKLKMEGSLIANTDLIGNDKGNLNIKAGALETNDFLNFNNNSEKGLGFGISTSLSNDEKDERNESKQAGSTSMNLVDKGSIHQSITHATIGQGKIEIADRSDLLGINREVHKAETTTKDKITGALGVTVSIDNRLLVNQIEEWINAVFGENVKHYTRKTKEANDYFKPEKDEKLTLIPTFGLRESHTGRETYNPKTNELSKDFKDKYNGKTPDELSLWEKLTSAYDINPVFKILDAIIPGLHSSANVHDTQFRKENVESLNEETEAKVLRYSIPSSFIGTYLSIIYGKMPSWIKRTITSLEKETEEWRNLYLWL